MKKIAILYQATPAPSIDGIKKPMKEGGYSDSGADIGYSLQKNNFNLITPATSPNTVNDLDWVFPDTEEGINFALEKKAEVLWLNTVLFKSHALNKFKGIGLELIGQEIDLVDEFDNKWLMRELLLKHDIPVPAAQIIEKNKIHLDQDTFSFPLIIKPLRGRGSQGVVLVKDIIEFNHKAMNLFDSGLYGNRIYAESFLAGIEITLTIMPPGAYQIKNSSVKKNTHWCLPPVKRFNHVNSIAPYSGKVAVTKNSKVLNGKELLNDNIQIVMKQCAQVGTLINSKAPIRIDCRANENGSFFLFDINLKPNLTGSSREHRKNQDSLTTIAAAAIGWSYNDLITNLYTQKWEF